MHAVEALVPQEDVMEFVNSIAKIVHMEVSLHGGAANKNIGDAFLLVWKFPRLVGHHHHHHHRHHHRNGSAPTTAVKDGPERTQRVSSLGIRCASRSCDGAGCIKSNRRK
jgi:class 3 adenylate cyclase